MNVLIVSGANHGFDRSAPIIGESLATSDIDVMITDEKEILASSEMSRFDVCVFGTGFTRTVRRPDGSLVRERDLTTEQEDGLFRFVHGGKGLVGVHGTAWWIGGRAVDLIGGHANWHPPGLSFAVHVEDATHPVMQGIDDFEVEDEIYISAYDPDIHILASAEWQGRAHPMAWVKPYGDGSVFYTTLGHGPNTFERPAMQRLLRQGVRWAAGA